MSLEVRDLAFGYTSKKLILDGFDLDVADGERVGIHAPSGRGKTTLCKIIAGYMKPQRGTVRFDRQDVHAMKGYMPIQMIWQHPEKSVNFRLKMGSVIAEGDNIDNRILDGLGIERDWFNRYPTELSGGEIQRFCIARALGERTRFIIADEISTMLDVITQSQIWDFLLDEVERRRIGMIAITHSDPLMGLVTTRTVELPDSTSA